MRRDVYAGPFERFGWPREDVSFQRAISDHLRLAARLARAADADALLLLVEGPFDWDRLKTRSGEKKLVVAADFAAQIEGAAELGMATVVLDMPDSPVYERLTQSVLEAVADDILTPGSSVVALYSGFDADTIDSLSVSTSTSTSTGSPAAICGNWKPACRLDTLKIVVDLAVEIGREGREGKPVGTLFVVGDSRKVLACSRPTGFDPVRGYSRKERNLDDPRVREGIKEIAQMDGAIIVSPDGVVEAPAAISMLGRRRDALARASAPGIGPPPPSAGRPTPWP